MVMANVAEIKRNAPEGSIINKMSEAKIQELLDKEIKYDKAAQRAKDIGTRLRIKNTLILMKARKAGIVVTEEEVKVEMKRRGI
jgi:hypothetical protein